MLFFPVVCWKFAGSAIWSLCQGEGWGQNALRGLYFWCYTLTGNRSEESRPTNISGTATMHQLTGLPYHTWDPCLLTFSGSEIGEWNEAVIINLILVKVGPSSEASTLQMLGAKRFYKFTSFPRMHIERKEYYISAWQSNQGRVSVIIQVYTTGSSE